MRDGLPGLLVGHSRDERPPEKSPRDDLPLELWGPAGPAHLHSLCSQDDQSCSFQQSFAIEFVLLVMFIAFAAEDWW